MKRTFLGIGLLAGLGLCIGAYASFVSSSGSSTTAASTITGTVGVTQGGTGISTIAVGQVPYGSAADTISALAVGTSGHFLKTNGAGEAPSWAAAGVTYPTLADDSYAESTPSYSRSGDTDTGIAFPAANILGGIAAGELITQTYAPTAAHSIFKVGTTASTDITIMYLEGSNMASGGNQSYFSITDGSSEWAWGYGLGGGNNTKALQFAPGSGAAIAMRLTFTNGALVAENAFTTTSDTVNLTADNQEVTTNTRSFLKLTSDNTTPTNRTFTLASGEADGQRLTIMWNDNTNGGELVDTGTSKISSEWLVQGNMQYKTLNLIWDGTNWVELSRSNN